MSETNDNQLRLLFVAIKDDRACWVIETPPLYKEGQLQAISFEDGVIFLLTEDGNRLELNDEIFSDDTAQSSYVDAISSSEHHITEFECGGFYKREYEIDGPTLVKQPAFGV